MEIIKVFIVGGYANVPKIGAWIDDKEYILDTSQVEELLKKMIESNGYIITQTTRQKYPRLIIK